MSIKEKNQENLIFLSKELYLFIYFLCVFMYFLLFKTIKNYKTMIKSQQLQENQLKIQ